MEDFPRSVLVVGLIVLAGVSWAIAAGPDRTEAPSQRLVARLESQLEAQQARLEDLERQVAAAAQQDTNAARSDLLRQQVRTVLSEQEFRESLMPSTLQAGYDGGFFIRSADDKFRMQFNGLLQFRYTYYNKQSRNRYLVPGFDSGGSRSGFDFQRADFTISGHAYSPDLTFNIEMGSGTGVGYDTGLNYGWVNYRFAEAFQVRAGIINIASTRSATASFATYQFVDNPMFDTVFGLGDGLGVRFWGNLMEGQGTYYLDIVNSLGSFATRTITNDEILYTAGHDNNPAIAFRTVWAILGGKCLYPNDEPDYVAPCDLAWHDDPALNIGFHYAFNEDNHDGTLRIPFPRKTFFREGGFGLTSSDGLQIHQLGLDAGFKYQGFSATAEYAIRLLDVRRSNARPVTPLFLATGDDSTNAQHGAYLQCGYFLPIPGQERKFEVVARAGGISALSSGQEGVWEYAGGVNYYIDGHNVKLQADVTHIHELPTSSSNHSFANVNDDAWILRMQLQLAF
jgi:phosphate-selective porin OprO/OprP